MSFYKRTYVQLPESVNPTAAIARTSQLVHTGFTNKPLRIWTGVSNVWIGVEHLGFFSMQEPDESTSATEVSILARVWNSETIMIAAQSTASCAAYARFVSGSLVRFLSAGDSMWFESVGVPESWERELLGVEPQNHYPSRSDTTFSDGTVRRIASRLMLPRPEDAALEQVIE